MYYLYQLYLFCFIKNNTSVNISETVNHFYFTHKK